MGKCKDSCEHKPYENYDDLLSCCEDLHKPIFYVDVTEYKAIKCNKGYGKIKGKKRSSGYPCCDFGTCKKPSCNKCCRKFKGVCC